MKLQKIISRLERLHPREISLTLGRIRRLNKELGNPQDKLNVISVCGTNGKGSTAGAILSILESANYTCDLYTSPHCVKINERFIFLAASIDIAMHMGKNDSSAFFGVSSYNINVEKKKYDAKYADSEKFIREVFENRKYMKMDDYVIDMHCSLGRKLGKNKIDFIA